MGRRGNNKVQIPSGTFLCQRLKARLVASRGRKSLRGAPGSSAGAPACLHDTDGIAGGRSLRRAAPCGSGLPAARSGGLPPPLEMRPRRVLLGPIPVGRQRACSLSSAVSESKVSSPKMMTTARRVPGSARDTSDGPADAQAIRPVRHASCGQLSPAISGTVALCDGGDGRRWSGPRRGTRSSSAKTTSGMPCVTCKADAIARCSESGRQHCCVRHAPGRSARPVLAGRRGSSVTMR